MPKLIKPLMKVFFLLKQRCAQAGINSVLGCGCEKVIRCPTCGSTGKYEQAIEQWEVRDDCAICPVNDCVVLHWEVRFMCGRDPKFYKISR